MFFRGRCRGVCLRFLKAYLCTFSLHQYFNENCSPAAKNRTPFIFAAFPSLFLFVSSFAFAFASPREKENRRRRNVYLSFPSRTIFAFFSSFSSLNLRLEFVQGLQDRTVYLYKVFHLNRLA